jgi:hypothetical protein
MRILISSFLLFLVGIIHSQTSISGGTYSHFGNLFNNGNPTYSGKPNFTRYNGIVLQGDYTKNTFRVYGEFGYTQSSFDFIRYNTSTYGGGSSPYYLNKTEYHSDVFISYFTFKLGLGSDYKFSQEKKRWGSFSYNVFFQYDKLFRENESNQVRYSTTTKEITPNQYETTVSPPDYSSFDLISFNKNIFQLGLELKARFGWENYFVELSSSLSISDRFRSNLDKFDYDINVNQTSTWYLNTGLKLGYLLKKKTKASQNKSN